MAPRRRSAPSVKAVFVVAAVAPIVARRSSTACASRATAASISDPIRPELWSIRVDSSPMRSPAWTNRSLACARARPTSSEKRAERSLTMLPM